MGTADDRPKQTFFRIGSAVVKEGTLKNMTAADIKVLMALSLHANWTTGKCWPSVRTIRDLTGCSFTSISTAIRRLVGLGLIDCEKVRVKKHGIRNVYVVYKTPRDSRGGCSKTTDDPTRRRERGILGRFTSKTTDDPCSKTTDDPCSSGMERNETYLNESNGTRSKDNAPPPLPGSGQTPPATPTGLTLHNQRIQGGKPSGEKEFKTLVDRLVKKMGMGS